MVPDSNEQRNHLMIEGTEVQSLEGGRGEKKTETAITSLSRKRLSSHNRSATMEPKRYYGAGYRDDGWESNKHFTLAILKPVGQVAAVADEIGIREQ